MAPGVSTQLRRGVLEHCVLALLAEDERYGFDLARSLGAVEALAASEGTVYPILTRLKREGHVATVWRESDAGPPRKYYSITDQGRLALAEFAAEWVRFRAAVDLLLDTGGTP